MKTLQNGNGLCLKHGLMWKHDLYVEEELEKGGSSLLHCLPLPCLQLGFTFKN